MNATRIPKEGCYRHFFCEKCASDTMHHVLPMQYRMYTVDAQVVCSICLQKYVDIKTYIEKHPLLGIEIETLFYTPITMDNEDFNEFIKWADYD